MRAAVGDKVLANVDAYFPNDLESIATELLQNARRAGASKVEIALDRARSQVTFTDDGRGLDSTAVVLLLTFGGSANEDVVEHDETPAGMGFFSLARRGAEVRSRDWRLVVPPDAFTGRLDADLETGLETVAGMAVTFGTEVAIEEGDYRAAVATMRRASAPIPFATTIDGVTVARGHPLDWLRTEAGTPLFSDIVDRRIGDCLLTVARFEDGKKRWQREDGRAYDRAIHPPWLYMRYDLFGQILALAEDLVASLEPSLWVPAERPIVVFDRPDRPRLVTPNYVVVAEALGSQTLTARLPDRRELVVTGGLRQVLAAAVELIALLAARAPRNGVEPFSEIRSAAARKGIDIPPAQKLALRLPTARTEPDDNIFRPDDVSRLALVSENGRITYRRKDLPDHVVLLVDPGSTISTLLTRTLARDRFVVGHQPIDGLDRAMSIDLEIDGRTTALAREGRFDDDALARANPLRKGATLASRLVFSLLTYDGTRLDRALRHAVLPAAGPPAVHVVAIVKADVHEIVDDLESVAFRFDEVDDTDEATQRERFRRRHRRTILGALASTAHVVADALEGAMREAEAAVASRIHDVRLTHDGPNRRLHVTMDDGSHSTIPLT